MVALDIVMVGLEYCGYIIFSAWLLWVIIGHFFSITRPLAKALGAKK